MSDPRAPEWKLNLDSHLQWWEKIIKKCAAQNYEYLTITPEFGPPDYMPTLPYSREPVSDLWEVNLFMKELLEKKFNNYL